MKTTVGTPFEKGKSGNPGGRPKVIGEVRELAREHTQDAIDTLARIMKSTKAPPAARVAAANSLLDRGYGKPAIDMTVTTKRLVEWTNEELIAAGAAGTSKNMIDFQSSI